MVEGLSQTLDLKMHSVDLFLRFQDFESKDLGPRFPSLEFSRTSSGPNVSASEPVSQWSVACEAFRRY